jgi:hypothetical protein
MALKLKLDDDSGADNNVHEDDDEGDHIRTNEGKSLMVTFAGAPKGYGDLS